MKAATVRNALRSARALGPVFDLERFTAAHYADSPAEGNRARSGAASVLAALEREGYVRSFDVEDETFYELTLHGRARADEVGPAPMLQSPFGAAQQGFSPAPAPMSMTAQWAPPPPPPPPPPAPVYYSDPYAPAPPEPVAHVPLPGTVDAKTMHTLYLLAEIRRLHARLADLDRAARERQR